MNILSKRQNFRLWQAGAFGNKLRAWRTVEEWRASGFANQVVLRVLLPAGGGPTRYNLEPENVDSVVEAWVRDGVPREAIMVNEAAPDKLAILQGEYLNDVRVVDGEIQWACFHYTRVAAHMHIALKVERRTAFSLCADLLLKDVMTSSSYEDWQSLLEQYPGHVFEVSVYGRCLGDLSNRNALVWEVRKY